MEQSVVAAQQQAPASSARPRDTGRRFGCRLLHRRWRRFVECRCRWRTTTPRPGPARGGSP
ncbi:hypothetical protein, partial [Desulfosarcina cetonica]|uniref:hypothetical protein n=1 Tax=Desulfosarcina cetonica TaxID=90730 RepID=UPI001C44174A